MYPTYQLFGRDFSTYTLMAGIGTMLTVLYVLFSARKYKVTRDDSVYIYTFGLIGFGLGSKILYLLLNIGKLVGEITHIQGKEEIAHIYSAFVLGGFAIQGGIAGFVLLTRRMAKLYKVDIKDFYPVIIPAFCFFCAMGRIGCFLEGCCYGIELNEARVPVQLIAASLNFVMGIGFIVFDPVIRKKDMKNRFSALMMPVYILLYSIGRFSLDFFRGDISHIEFLNLKVSQITGVVFIVTAIIWIVLDIKHRRSYNS